jgi:hypothetical protein
MFCKFKKTLQVISLINNTIFFSYLQRFLEKMSKEEKVAAVVAPPPPSVGHKRKSMAAEKEQEAEAEEEQEVEGEGDEDETPPTKKLRTLQDKVVLEVKETLECPICMEFMEGNIFQCQQGHTLCEGCRDKLITNAQPAAPKCPTCKKSDSLVVRNIALEKIANAQLFPCRFEECTEIIPLGERKMHESKCTFQYLCPYPNSEDPVICHSKTEVLSEFEAHPKMDTTETGAYEQNYLITEQTDASALKRDAGTVMRWTAEHVVYNDTEILINVEAGGCGMSVRVYALSSPDVPAFYHLTMFGVTHKFCHASRAIPVKCSKEELKSNRVSCLYIPFDDMMRMSEESVANLKAKGEATHEGKPVLFNVDLRINLFTDVKKFYESVICLPP